MAMIQIILKRFKTFKYLNVYHQHVGDTKLIDMDISDIYICLLKELEDLFVRV